MWAVCQGCGRFLFVTQNRNFGPHVIPIVLLDEKMILGGVGGLSGGVGVFLFSLTIVILVLISFLLC